MISRHLAKVLKVTARQYPVITLTGPRQSGKTTLVQRVFPRHQYTSLEDPENRKFALEDPRGFLGQFRGNVILDEVQQSPELFSYIQGIVDAEDKPGRFILTGSQNFLLHRRVTQSLAGRCAILKLLPLCRSELIGRPIRDLDKVVQSAPVAPRAGLASESTLFQTLLKGGYPRIHDKQLPPGAWLANYFQTYLERDVRDLLNVGEIETFGRFVGLCAGRSGQLLNLSSLAADAGISHTTARRWVSTLDASYIVFLLRPHHVNFNKRLIKSPKLYFVDSGLLCYLLGIRRADDLLTHSARGAIFETWVVSETLKNCHNRGEVSNLYFWRDSTGHEIDLLVDRGQDQFPIEIKSGQTVAGDFLADIAFWRALAGRPDNPAALVYGGASSYQRQGVSVRSWLDWV